MNNFKIISAGLIIGALCFFAGRFYGPKSVEIKEVEKVVYKQSTDITRNVDKKETIRPDGTRIIETVSSTKRQSETSVDKESSKDSVTESRPNWRINVSYMPQISDRQDQIVIVDLQRRIIGEVYFGLSGSTQNNFGISLGLGF